MMARPMRGSATWSHTHSTAEAIDAERDVRVGLCVVTVGGQRLGLSRRRPARVRTIAATQSPAKPSAPARARAPSAFDVLRGHEAVDGLVARRRRPCQ